VATDTDLERRLRGALHDQAGTDGLPERMLLDSLSVGRTALRRRRLGAAAVAACVAVAAGIALAAVQRGEDDLQPAPPAPSPTVQPVSPASLWAGSLPRGRAAADVPYLADTWLVQPDGSRIPIAGEKVELVGMSVAGPVLLVGTEADGSSSISWRYENITSDGAAHHLPVTVDTCCASEHALLSPDGVLFTRGDEIVDLTDAAPGGRLPEDVKIPVAWTPVGVVYLADDGHYRLWNQTGSTITLASNPGVFAPGSDVAVDLCGTIHRLGADGSLTELSSDCVPGAWSVSPDGRWVLTDALELVDVASGESRALADRDVINTDATQHVRWDDDAVLFPAGGYLVRCGTGGGSCERVAGPEYGLALP
jgi:hypothetical protein